MFEGLIVRFEKDIRLGAHSVELEVQRSMAGKELCDNASAAFPEVVAHLEQLPSSGNNAVEQNVQAALAILIARFGYSLRLDVPPRMRFGDKDGWVAWAKGVMAAGLPPKK